MSGIKKDAKEQLKYLLQSWKEDKITALYTQLLPNKPSEGIDVNDKITKILDTIRDTEIKKCIIKKTGVSILRKYVKENELSPKEGENLEKHEVSEFAYGWIRLLGKTKDELITEYDPKPKSGTITELRNRIKQMLKDLYSPTKREREVENPATQDCRETKKRRKSLKLDLKAKKSELDAIFNQEKSFVTARDYLKAHDSKLKADITEREIKKLSEDLEDVEKRIKELEEELQAKNSVKEEAAKSQALKFSEQEIEEVTSCLHEPNYYIKEKPEEARNNCWAEFFGSNAGEGKCPICSTSLRTNNSGFEKGHIISDRQLGPTQSWNLVPICQSCNKSCSAGNLFDYCGKGPELDKRAAVKKIAAKKFMARLKKPNPPLNVNTLLIFVNKFYAPSRIQDYKDFLLLDSNQCSIDGLKSL